MILEVLAASDSVDRALDVPIGSNPGSAHALVVIRYLDAAGLRGRWEGAGPPQRELG